MFHVSNFIYVLSLKKIGLDCLMKQHFQDFRACNPTMSVSGPLIYLSKPWSIPA